MARPYSMSHTYADGVWMLWPWPMVLGVSGLNPCNGSVRGVVEWVGEGLAWAWSLLVGVSAPPWHAIRLYYHTEVDISFSCYAALSGPIDLVSLTVSAIANPVAFVSPFIQLATAFMEHKYMCASLW